MNPLGEIRTTVLKETQHKVLEKLQKNEPRREVLEELRNKLLEKNPEGIPE